MTRRLLDWDGTETGLAHWWHEDGEGNWAQESVQDAAPILDLNKERQNHHSPRADWCEGRMVACIPLIVIQKWRNELGVDYWNPDHQDKVDALLADPEWRWLRVDTGNAGRTQVLMMDAAGVDTVERPLVLKADGTPMTRKEDT